MSNELLPCPFCGNKARMSLSGAPVCYVVCSLCTTCGPVARTEDDAISAWNRRTPQPVTPAGGEVAGWTTLHGIPDWAIAKAYRDAVNRFDPDSRGPSATIFASNVTVAADHAYREWSSQNRDLATDPQSLAEWLRVHHRGDFPTPEYRWIHELLSATHPPVADAALVSLEAELRLTAKNIERMYDLDGLTVARNYRSIADRIAALNQRGGGDHG